MHTPKTLRYVRRALTRTELIVTILIVGIVLCLLMCAGAAGIMLPALAKARSSARQIKCGTQVRNVIQAMTIFAQGNKDMYPLPSVLDPNNQTTAVAGRAKDTSNNVLSVLCFNSMVDPMFLYCPSESTATSLSTTGTATATPPRRSTPPRRCGIPPSAATLPRASVTPPTPCSCPAATSTRT
jgi:hypothetical protein